MNEIPFNYSISKTNLPLIISSNTPHLCFLIDTGSTHNLIFSYVLEKCNNISPLASSVSISGIVGIKEDLRQINMKLKFENKCVDTILSVIEAPEAINRIQQDSGIQIHGILGVPFLTQNKWIIDFKNLTIKTEIK